MFSSQCSWSGGRTALHQLCCVVGFCLVFSVEDSRGYRKCQSALGFKKTLSSAITSVILRELIMVETSDVISLQETWDFGGLLTKWSGSVQLQNAVEGTTYILNVLERGTTSYASLDNMSHHIQLNPVYDIKLLLTNVWPWDKSSMQQPKSCCTFLASSLLLEVSHHHTYGWWHNTHLLSAHSLSLR